LLGALHDNVIAVGDLTDIETVPTTPGTDGLDAFATAGIARTRARMVEITAVNRFMNRA
jgi:hypothetical protein